MVKEKNAAVDERMMMLERMHLRKWRANKEAELIKARLRWQEYEDFVKIEKRRRRWQERRAKFRERKTKMKIAMKIKDFYRRQEQNNEMKNDAAESLLLLSQQATNEYSEEEAHKTGDNNDFVDSVCNVLLDEHASRLVYTPSTREGKIVDNSGKTISSLQCHPDARVKTVKRQHRTKIITERDAALLCPKLITPTNGKVWTAEDGNGDVFVKVLYIEKKQDCVLTKVTEKAIESKLKAVDGKAIVRDKKAGGSYCVGGYGTMVCRSNQRKATITEVGTSKFTPYLRNHFKNCRRKKRLNDSVITDVSVLMGECAGKVRKQFPCVLEEMEQQVTKKAVVGSFFQFPTHKMQRCGLNIIDGDDFSIPCHQVAVRLSGKTSLPSLQNGEEHLLTGVHLDCHDAKRTNGSPLFYTMAYDYIEKTKTKRKPRQKIDARK